MGVLMILVFGAVVLALGGRFYAPLIGRVLGERADRVTPAVELNDGRDYVPTKTPVVFAHHYASIAGAGPIIGPVIAILYGWGPALAWVLLGGIFLGAVHDFAATHVTMREGGKNLTVVARRTLGAGAFGMLLVIMIALLVLVCAAFLDLSATALTSRVSVEMLELEPGQTLVRVEDGQAIIGGIASTSVIVITACSPLIGFLYLKRKWSVGLCSLLAMAICGVSIWIGLRWPMPVEPGTWKYMISAYVLVSAGLPVWLFLQSRDFINVHLLYAGIAFLVVAVFAAALRGGGQAAGAEPIPLNNWGSELAEQRLGPGWPAMFVLIACGAVSGFHSLCAGGTTCKQLNNELAARRVGFYAMLLESFLAVCVICCLLVGLSFSGYLGFAHPVGGKGNAILTFAMAVGRTANIGLGVPVAAGALGAMLLLEGFLVTTLDTAIRLTRYMLEEGWATIFGSYDVYAMGGKGEQGTGELAGTGGLGVAPADGAGGAAGVGIKRTRGLGRAVLRMLQLYWVNSGLAVALMLVLALTNGYNAVWQIFGAANQLLAALGLLVVSSWLLKRGRSVWYTLLPAGFMLVTSVGMLVWLLWRKYLPGWRHGDAGMAPLLIADVLVLATTMGLVWFTGRCWYGWRNGVTAPALAEVKNGV